MFLSYLPSNFLIEKCWGLAFAFVLAFSTSSISSSFLPMRGLPSIARSLRGDLREEPKEPLHFFGSCKIRGHFIGAGAGVYLVRLLWWILKTLFSVISPSTGRLFALFYYDNYWSASPPISICWIIIGFYNLSSFRSPVASPLCFLTLFTSTDIGLLIALFCSFILVW